MTIYFDAESAYWSDDNEANKCFLDYQTDYIRDLVKRRGYVYLNQIHEMLGAGWNPKYENPCIENADFAVVVGWDYKCGRWVVDIY